MHLLSWFFTKCHYVKTDDINAEYVSNTIQEEIQTKAKRTFTPLIDWNYANPTTDPNGMSYAWKQFSEAVQYTSIYSDGRFATLIYPLKQPFTDFEELMLCFPDGSGGSPDQDTRIFKSDVFDFLLKFPINKGTARFDSINTPDDYYAHCLNLWIPYGGSSWYATGEWYAKSTKTRLVGLHGYSFPILEIYGIK